ncbi:tetratricopeptide repeat protein [Nostoc sp. UHCC 0870]
MLFVKITRKNKLSVGLQAVTFASVLCFAYPTWGQQATKTNLRKDVCEPIAKVISKGNSNWPFLKQLCDNDVINSSSVVEVFCYLNGRILNISSGEVGKVCLISSEQVRGCSYKKIGDCPKIKGPDEDDAPTLITPHGVAILNSRPTISWIDSPMATSYIVQIEGKGVNWSVEIQDTQLPYPQDQPALQPGNVYNLNVIVKQGDEPKTATSSVFALIAQQRAEKVQGIIKRLEELNMPQDELAIDANYVYGAENLLNKAIEVLESQVKSGSQNPTVYRLLGERYLEVNLSDLAKQAYTKAIRLAQKKGDTNELVKARAGVQILNQIQLPMRRKAPQ